MSARLHTLIVLTSTQMAQDEIKRLTGKLTRQYAHNVIVMM